MKFGDLAVDMEVEDGSINNIGHDLLTFAATGNSTFLEEFLKVNTDLNITDSKGRTPLVSVS